MIFLYFRLRKQRQQRIQRVIAKRQTLSKRYQIKENIKSTRFLLPVISFLTVTACTCMIILLLSYHTLLVNIRIFDFVLSLRSLIVPIIVARGHCAFRNQLIAFLATATNLVSNSDTETLQSRATRSGGQVYAVMSAVDMHFQSLRNAWEMQQSLQHSRP
uniref:Uncharacterized protein n=1 Tax=Panagrolaimus sp. PS1159 TaxID=55785 RepID=A0AC35GIY4_9BILA